MSYLDQAGRKRPTSIAAVAFLHVGLGYAIITGLAIKVIPFVPTVTTATTYEDQEDPPIKDDPPPPTTQRTERVKFDPPIVLVEHDFPTGGIIPIDPPSKPTLETIIKVAPPPPTITPSQARAAEPGAGRAEWVTSDDYPPQSLREGATGMVGISVLVGADGRVQACEVTRSSGNAILDDATCRTYARRARFKPALDAEGKAVAARHADRIRWELPE
jgi:protein TonB